MTQRAARLAARRAQLLARSERLRLELASDATELTGHFRLLDTVASFGRSGTGRLLLFGGAALVLLVGRGRTLTVARRLVAAWPLIRPILPEVAHYLRALRERSAHAGAGSAGEAGPAADPGRGADA